MRAVTQGKNVRRHTAAALAAVVVVLLALVFFLRPPVLILTDAAFDRIYGEKRAGAAAGRLSLAFFRRVKPVRVGENAGPDMVVFALETAAANPYCVLVPYRYADGARRYAREFPETPVGVLGAEAPELSRENGEGSPLFFSAGREDDMYRAGRCAAILGGGGTVLVYHNGDPSAFRPALEEGLDGGAELRLLGPGAEFENFDGVSCVILGRHSQPFTDNAPDIPVILFSWLDPALTTRETKVIFDDSPWAQAFEAVKMTVRGKAASVPSRMILPWGRTAGGEILERLREVPRFYRK
ncbi:MAG: hypothetical protein LBK08_09285 [Treponema sp.]|jgi:hypothetical protein|nr:hypothetical protein [Treponema sp.]